MIIIDFVYGIINSIFRHFINAELALSTIFAVLLVTFVLSFYEFLVYRGILHRALYNKAFNITITIVPYFIATIILCLQSSLVVTLGTIGALAIVRFRSAVKDPVDMIFILWSVHIGITCGCQLYSVAALTSVAVTVVLLVLNRITVSGRTQLLVLHMKEQKEELICELLEKNSKKYRIKSRSFTTKGLDYVIEIITRDPARVTEELTKLECVERFSLMEYDPDDIL